ncbi:MULTISPECIES: ATP-binding protein [unclassified Crossiella]|uniref:ATP-binding protein n=1 Tax=unclassified Crossiella TaxID=2620835 RepID=UPI001FFFF1BA|nr:MULTISPECIES: ATP-binding protein [unclassified Crossiella]MCK2245330.1 putative DNA binding domain-containing protein [Crossiella sp. S99.2]MCK2258968.1 putative DNA binding domain-containing protein [Crossiella sp. S99.1]
MLDEELAEIVANLRVLGSDVAGVEAKKAAGGLPRSVRETLSAFANTRGGTVILGLDEQSGFTATGLSDAAKMSADLADLCATGLEPPLRPLIGIHRFEGAQLLVAEIPELSLESKPCYYRGAGITQGSYLRLGDGDYRMSSYEVQLLLANRGQPRHDEEPVPGTSLADFDPALVAELVSRLRTRRPYAYGELDDAAVLRRIRTLVPDGNGADVASLGGLLALGRYPQEHFPQLMITFVHYPTVDGADLDTGERFVDNVVAEGPIPVMVRDTLLALRKNMARRSVVRDAGRADVWEYPEAALREAVVNALVHRDLSNESRGTQVQVEMYPDRLVVRNPGGLFGPVSEDRLGEEGVSSTRNATLLRILEDVPIPGSNRAICENRGSGIRTMLSALRSAQLGAPEFRNRVSTFTVTFPNHTLLSDEVIAWINSLGERGLSQSQCLGLAILRGGGLLDNQTYRNATRVDSRVATQELSDLIARELVEQVGTHRWTRYRLAGGLIRTPAAGEAPKGRADRRVDVLNALADNELSRAELAATTGLTDKTVARWLGILRKEGLVVATEEQVRSPTVRYRRTGKIAFDQA